MFARADQSDQTFAPHVRNCREGLARLLSNARRLLQRHRLARDRNGDFTLELENIFDGAVEVVGPDLVVGGAVDEGRGNDNVVVGTLDGAFDEALDLP